MPCAARPLAGRDGTYHPRWKKVRKTAHCGVRKSKKTSRNGTSSSEEGRCLRVSSESRDSDFTPEKAAVVAPWVKQPCWRLEEAGLLAAGNMFDLAKRPAKLPEQPTVAEQPRPSEELLSRPGADLLSGLAAVYKSVSSTATPPSSLKASCFHSVREPPAMPLGSYLTRLRTYCQCSDACFIASLVYVDRAVKRQPSFEVSNLTIHRLVAASVVVGAKFLDDTYYSNAYYAKVCGVSVKHLNSLEVAMLKCVDWNLSITSDEFDYYCSIVLWKLPAAIVPN